MKNSSNSKSTIMKILTQKKSEIMNPITLTYEDLQTEEHLIENYTRLNKMWKKAKKGKEFKYALYTDSLLKQVSRFIKLDLPHSAWGHLLQIHNLHLTDKLTFEDIITYDFHKIFYWFTKFENQFKDEEYWRVLKLSAEREWKFESIPYGFWKVFFENKNNKGKENVATDEEWNELLDTHPGKITLPSGLHFSIVDEDLIYGYLDGGFIAEIYIDEVDEGYSFGVNIKPNSGISYSAVKKNSVNSSLLNLKKICIKK